MSGEHWRFRLQQNWKGLVNCATLVGICGGVSLTWMQRSIAQSADRVPIAFVATAEDDVSVRTIPGYAPRFSEVLGSGELLLNADNEVTGYYFTVSDLEPGTEYAYHFHAAMNNGTPTSCEGEKALVDDEAGGQVITNLGAIAPPEISSGGVARVGSPSSPVELTEPVPLSAIGYVNIHPAPGAEVGPGTVCANVRLNPGGFAR